MIIVMDNACVLVLGTAFTYIEKHKVAFSFFNVLIFLFLVVRGFATLLFSSFWVQI